MWVSLSRWPDIEANLLQRLMALRAIGSVVRCNQTVSPFVRRMEGLVHLVAAVEVVPARLTRRGASQLRAPLKPAWRAVCLLPVGQPPGASVRPC